MTEVGERQRVDDGGRRSRDGYGNKLGMKELLSFLMQDIMGSDSSENHRIAGKFECKSIVFGYRSFPSVLRTLYLLGSEGRMRHVVQK